MKKISGLIALVLIATVVLSFALSLAGPSTTNAETDFSGRIEYANVTITRSQPTMDPVRVISANGIQLLDKEGTTYIDGVKFTIKHATNSHGEMALCCGISNKSEIAFATQDGDEPNVAYILHEGEYIVTIPSKWRSETRILAGVRDADGLFIIKRYSLSKWNATFPDKAISEEYLRDWNEANDWTMVLGTFPDTRLGTLNNDDVAQVFTDRQAKIDAWNRKYPSQAFTGNCYPEIYALYGANGTGGGSTTPTPSPSPSPSSSIPATGTAYPSTLAVEIDGKKVEFQVYYLKDANGYPTNYIKVRDLAYVINGTKAQFAVEWNGTVSKADLVTGKAYTANGSENNTPFNNARPYSLPQNATCVNGVPSDLVAFMLFDDNGGGYTYYQLRDLGRKLGFNVGWNTERAIAYIETDKPYVG